MGRHLTIVLIGALWLGSGACGGCDEDAGRHGENQGQGDHDIHYGDTSLDALGPDGSVGLDGSVPEVDGGDAPDATWTWDPADGCPNAYQEVCGDVCINVKVDPDNCGGCGIVCDEGQVCSGGSCADSCVGNETACGRSCVLTNSNNDHCGGCDNACGEGLGCNNGVCVPAIVFDTPAMCAGGGPPIQIEGENIDECAGELAEERFRWAMCACNEVNLTVGGLFTDAFDSNEGPYVPGVLGGSVGVNGDFKCTATVNIGGSLWAGGGSNVDLRGVSTVHMDMMVDGDLSAGGSQGIDILENSSVGAGLSPGGGGIRIGDTLTVPEGLTVRPGVTYGSLVRAPVDIAPPCMCGPDEVLPISNIIASRRDNNDNALIGLSPNLLIGETDARRLDLPCGHYFLNGINVNTDITIVAHGRTALYIQGDVNAGRLTFLAAPEAELDVFIDGRVQAAGITFGNPTYPAATRFYLGGDNRLQVTRDVNIGGFIYAYPGQIHITQDVEIYGGIFANNISVTSALSIHYDRRILRAGDDCREQDPDPDPDPDADAGPGPDVDPDPDAGSDPDPDPDQCIALEGSCSVDSDCCAPLVCDQGKCSTIRCRGTNESCVYNSDCCSGICGIASGQSSGLCIAN